MNVIDNIKNWINTKGFPFEINCAREFQKHGFTVQPAIHYFDDEIQNYREIDLCAFKGYAFGDCTFNLTLMIECKTSDSPWIVFSHKDKFSTSQLISNLITSKNGLELIKKIDVHEKESFAFAFKNDELVGYNFVQMGKSTTADKDKDRAYEALMQSSKAALSLKDKSNEATTKFCNIYIPVVIVDKNLFSASDAIDSTDLHVEEINFCKHARLYAFNERPLLVHHIVSGTHLEEYCQKILQDFDSFVDKYKNEIATIALYNPSNSNKGKYTIM